VTSTWSIGAGSSAKKFASRPKSVASKAATLAPSSLPAISWRSGFGAVMMTSAPCWLASRAVSKPMPALPPITTTL
jgi:hypothetical protein